MRKNFEQFLGLHNGMLWNGKYDQILTIDLVVLEKFVRAIFNNAKFTAFIM